METGATTRRLVAPALVLSASLLGACTATPASAPLSAPTIEAIGVFADERIADPARTYILADGRSFDISTNATRVLFSGGRGEPFVLGHDASGSFIGVFTRQDGLPTDCHLPGPGATGIERGAYVEINGVLWRKAPTFRTANIPAAGEPYPTSMRFCFNEQAEVAYTTP